MKKKSSESRRQALRKGGKREYGVYSRGEVTSLIAQLYYAEGMTQDRIADDLRQRGINFDRQAIADCLREMREKGQLKYLAPLESILATYVLDRNPRLHDALVVDSAVPQQIGMRGAEMLLSMLRLHKREARRNEIHVGFAGGRTPNLLAQALAELLSDLDYRDSKELETYPRQIHFHSLVGSIGLGNTLVDPNCYSIHFMESIRRSSWRYFQLRFYTLPLPGLYAKREKPRIVEIKQSLTKMEATKDSIDPAIMGKKLSIVVASCGHWGRNHLSFFDHVSASCSNYPRLTAAWERTVNQLEENDVIGDLAWCPIGLNGPIMLDTDLHVETLFGLPDLAQFAHPPASPKSASDGGKVLLLAGPCSGCGKPKGKLLQAILSMENPPVTHLITDSMTTDEYRTISNDFDSIQIS